MWATKMTPVIRTNCSYVLRDTGRLKIKNWDLETVCRIQKMGTGLDLDLGRKKKAERDARWTVEISAARRSFGKAVDYRS